MDKVLYILEMDLYIPEIFNLVMPTEKDFIYLEMALLTMEISMNQDLMAMAP